MSIISAAPAATFIHKTVTRSPALFCRLLCNDGAGSVVLDSSGAGNDASPLFALPWTAGQSVIVIGRIRTPSVPNGFVYEGTAFLGTGTMGATEPIWPTTAGVTVIDNAGANQITWTCRAVPNFWGTAGWFTMSGTAAGQLHFRSHSLLREQALAPVEGPVYTGAAGQVSFAAADISINCTTADFPAFAVGDWVLPNGDLVNGDNNAAFIVTSRTPNKITGGSSLINATPPGVVTLQKLYVPAQFLIAFWVNSSQTSGQLFPFILEDMLSAGGVYTLFNVRQNPSRQYQINYQTIHGTSESAAPAGTFPANTNNHVAIHINRATAAHNVYLNGTRVAVATGLTKRSFCSRLNSQSILPLVASLMRESNANGSTRFRDIQIYSGWNAPIDLGQVDPFSIAKIMDGGELSPGDWS